MSEKYTSIQTPSGGMGELDYISYEEAIAAARRFYEHQRKQADEVLSYLDDGIVTVTHHRGVHVWTDVREVLPGAS